MSAVLALARRCYSSWTIWKSLNPTIHNVWLWIAYAISIEVFEKISFQLNTEGD